MADYVNRWGLGALQPIACTGADGYLWVLEADANALRALCDRYLNAPTGGAVNYQPVSHYVLLNIEHAQKLSPADPPFDVLGLEETEAALWVMTASMREELGLQVVDHLAWFNPYMFVAEWLAIMGGREVYGFPKEQAWFAWPGDPANAGHFSIDVIGARQFVPATMLERIRLLDINWAAGAGAPEPVTLDDFFNVLRELLFDRPLVPSPELGLKLGEELFNRSIQLVFLKQFFDAADGTKACYQAIVEAPVRLTGPANLQHLPGDFQFTFQDLASHPIHRDLGLPLTQVVSGGFSIDVEYTIENGVTMWQAP